MSSNFPFVANFEVVSASTVDEVTAISDHVSARRRLSFVLRAERDVDIVLASGASLSSVDVHLSLLEGAATPKEVSPDLAAGDVGFLIQIAGAAGDDPFIHGAVMWPSGQLPYHLVGAGVRRRVQLTIRSFVQTDDGEPPHVWEAGSAGLLGIADYTIYCSDQPND